MLFFPQSAALSDNILLVKTPMGNTTMPATAILATNERPHFSLGVFQRLEYATSSGAGAARTVQAMSPPGSWISVCAAIAAEVCDLKSTKNENALRGSVCASSFSRAISAASRFVSLSNASRRSKSFAASSFAAHVWMRSRTRMCASCFLSRSRSRLSTLACHCAGTAATKSGNNEANARETSSSAA